MSWSIDEASASSAPGQGPDDGRRVWLTAAVGMAVGLGRPATALMVTALALVILSPLRRIEGRLEAREKRRKRRGDGADRP